MTRTTHQRAISFKVYQKQFHQALADEIKELRKVGGQTTAITDGHRMGKRNGKEIYSFTTDTEIRFPDDTPVDIIYQKQKHTGTLLSVEGFDLLIAIEVNIGEKITSARMVTEPWFLLQELQKRLDSALVHPNAHRKLAETLLSRSPDSQRENHRDFQQCAIHITEQTGKKLLYNSYQEQAITHVLQHPISFIWGPPGTGKTSTLGLTVASLVHAGESVLVLAHSNTAVDTAMKSLAKHLYQSSYYKEGLILRFGIATPGTYEDTPNINIRGIAEKQNPQLIQQIKKLETQRKKLTDLSRSPKLTSQQKIDLNKEIARIREELQPLKDQLRKRESELVRKAMVVGCTLSKSAIAEEIFQRKFDAVIVDEASMAYIPHCAYAATLANSRIGIFGDFRQLEPISVAPTEAAKQWLQRDVFEEAGVINCVNRQQQDDRLILLQIQYRMHPSIAAIPNKLFYNNRLENGEGIREQTQTLVNSPPLSGHSLILHDLSQAFAFCFSEQDSHSRFNLVSALVAADIAYKAQLSGTDSIGIITPYRAQARLLHRILKDTKQTQVKASTVHRFQGSEQKLIIFDAVDSTPKKKVGKLLKGGRQSTAARLANVAVSRAQGKFISLFNYSFLQQQLDSFNIFRQFIERLRHYSYQEPIVLREKTSNKNAHLWEWALPNVSVYLEQDTAQREIQSDLESTQETIAIDWPEMFNTKQYFSFKSLPPKINVIGRGAKAAAMLKGICNTRIWRSDSFSSMALVGIDQHILWIYTSPQTNAPIFRVALTEAVKLLYSFYEIVPSDLGSSVAQSLTEKKAPFGSCELCSAPLWPQPNRYGTFSLSCPRHPEQGRKIKPQDATRFAQFMGCTCQECGSALRGVHNSKTGKVFLRCTHSNCNWTIRLDQLI